MAKILIPTYVDDQIQFEMFCHCLQKNWQGEKNITVVIGKPYDADIAKKVDTTLMRNFDSSWHIEVFDGTISNVHGLCEMQTNKHIYSDVDTLVLDAKDFLLKPSDMSDYKNELYTANFYFPGHNHSDLYDRVPGDSDVPAVSTMTPWIWSPALLEGYMEWVESHYGKYNTWQNYPGGMEYCTWFVWAWNNPEIKKLIHTDPQNCPLRFGGIWPGQSAEGALQEEKDFDKWPQRKWWKHTRKVNDSVCLEVTCRVLKKYSIDPDYVDAWQERKKDMPEYEYNLKH